MKSIKGYQVVSRLALLGATLVGGSGCAPATPEDIREMEQLLATGFGGPDPRFLQAWDSPGEVDVCFVAPAGQETSALYVSGKQTVRSTIEDTWEASTGLDFVFNGDCPGTIDSDSMSIYLDTSRNSGAVAAMAGKGQRLSLPYLGADEWAIWGPRIENRTDIQVYVPVGPSASTIPLTTAHEVGHALGFYHEMERVENDDDCRIGFVKDSSKKLILDSQGNPIPIYGSNTFGHLTPYDANSVMLWSYCPTPERTNSSPVSAFDRLGAEMLYPKAGPLSIGCAEGCVLSGDGVILREDGVASDSWTARGALEWWDTNLFWKRGGMTVASGAEFDAGIVAAPGDHELNYSAVSKFNGDTIIGGGLVQISDAKWTSVAMTVL